MATSKAKSAPVKRNLHQTNAPFGFVFLTLLLVATFVFSTFYVISQSAREQTMRSEVYSATVGLEQRINVLQTQVNTLNAQVSSLQPKPVAVPTSTLPTAQRTR
ncbi:hypothetical protein KBB27_03410 [Patescibacteria group bacterium]|nr:hypothetical protein [Patescibacteria group bacterium]